MAAYKLKPHCTVEDAAGVAKTNVSAYWTQTWWRILFVAPEETVTEKVTARAPHNLLAQRNVRRHQAVVHAATGDIVGYARWILPSSHAAEWTEAQTPNVSDEERKRAKDAFDDCQLPFGDNQDEMDELDDPIHENKDEVAPKGPYMQLDYIATHRDHQRKGISSMLVKSGIEQANKLGLDILVVAMGEAATNMYKKHGFELKWDLTQSLKPWGHDDVYYTAILTKAPSQARARARARANRTVSAGLYTVLHDGASPHHLPVHPTLLLLCPSICKQPPTQPSTSQSRCTLDKRLPMPPFDENGSPTKKPRIEQATDKMALESLTLEHLPASHQVHLAMFKDVKNAAFLHQQLLARNAEFEYAFIDASVVFSRLQITSAVFKSTYLLVNDALKTPNVHSEIVTCLSPSNNIADAYRRFGISPNTKDLIVVKVTFPTESQPQATSGGQVWKHLEESVEGTAVPVTDENLASAADLPKIRKYYKLNGLNWLDSIKDDAVKQKEMETLVVGAMALRGL